MLRFGVNNGFAMKRWPEPEVWGRLFAERLRVSNVQLSLDLVDLDGPWSALQAQARRILRATREHDIEVRSVFTGLVDYSRNLLLDPDPGLRQRAFDRYVRAVELCALLGVKAFGGHFGAYSVADFADPYRRAMLAGVQMELVEGLAEQAEAAGLEELMWEPMPVEREPPHTIAEARARIGHGAPSTLCLCCDVGHACCAGAVGADADPYAWLSALADATPIVHVQQTDGRGDRHWAFTAETNAIGIIDPARIVATIAAAPESRVRELVLEIFPAWEAADERVAADLAESCDVWRPHVAPDPAFG